MGELLDRVPDAAYIGEWTALLQREVALQSDGDEQSVVVFRLAGEWLALKTTAFAEIAHVRSIHRIPHRKSPYLLGVVNIRGRLRLAVSLHRLLQLDLEGGGSRESAHKQYVRMVAIQRKEELWIFPVDEVYGNFRYKQGELQNVPVTVTKSTANYLHGVMAWEGKSVGVLDEELLFQSLKRGI